MLGAGRRKLLKKIDQGRIIAAIREAERQTSGEVRVSVSRFFWGSVRPVAERAFVRLGMSATKDRNAVLFFILPARRRFMILGDRGIHARVGQDFWDSLAAVLSEHFQRGEFTEGLIKAIEAAGAKLAEHFPYNAATDVNELSDEVEFK